VLIAVFRTDHVAECVAAIRRIFDGSCPCVVCRIQYLDRRNRICEAAGVHDVSFREQTIRSRLDHSRASAHLGTQCAVVVAADPCDNLVAKGCGRGRGRGIGALWCRYPHSIVQRRHIAIRLWRDAKEGNLVAGRVDGWSRLVGFLGQQEFDLMDDRLASFENADAGMRAGVNPWHHYMQVVSLPRLVACAKCSARHFQLEFPKAIPNIPHTETHSVGLEGLFELVVGLQVGISDWIVRCLLCCPPSDVETVGEIHVQAPHRPWGGEICAVGRRGNQRHVVLEITPSGSIGERLLIHDILEVVQLVLVIHRTEVQTMDVSLFCYTNCEIGVASVDGIDGILQSSLIHIVGASHRSIHGIFDHLDDLPQKGLVACC